MATKCYVGTYKKYNEGNLYGKWINLTGYSTYQDFLKACKELHKNEYDPEFMIQDWENLPDGFPAIEWIGEKDFNDIKAAMQDEEKASTQIIDYSEKAFAVVGDTKTIKDDLKRLGGRFNPKLSCGARWIFSKTKLGEVQQFLNCSEIAQNNAPKTENDTALWDEYKKRVLKAWNNDDSWWEHFKKETSALMMTECGVILAFEKKKIKVDFCWADEGPDYEHYQQVHKSNQSLQDYFIRENLRQYDDLIEELTNRKDEYGEPLLPVIYEHDYCQSGLAGWADSLHCKREYRIQDDEADPRTRNCVHRLTENDAQKALAILKSERAKMDKRLQAYLKRYGVSKLHTWTYWADR